eukprot:1086210-Prorocentrum_lima.AAC.1
MRTEPPPSVVRNHVCRCPAPSLGGGCPGSATPAPAPSPQPDGESPRTPPRHPSHLQPHTAA